MLGKIVALSFVVIWLRATYPRLREDQLQRFSWLVLIPLSLAMILVVAVVKVARGRGRDGGDGRPETRTSRNPASAWGC